jgi:hypothetical protein
MTLEAKSAAPLMYGAVYSDAPAMSWACVYFYARLQHHAPFTRQAPQAPSPRRTLRRSTPRICPMQSQPVSS